MKKVLIILLTCCILISLFFFVRATDLRMVVTLIQQIRYKFLILLVVTFLAYLAATISWQYALGGYRNKISTGRLFLIRHIGETVGMFNPASVLGGDALKAVILKSYDIPYKNVVWSILFSRGILVVSQLLFFFGTLAVLVTGNPSIYLNRLYPEQQSGWYPLMLAGWKNFRIKWSATMKELPLMLRDNKKALFVSFLFGLLHWFFGGLEFYFILKFLGMDVSVTEALLVDLGVVLFKSAGAFIPAQLGVEEYGNKFMLMVIGISSAQIWITASILRRARQLIWIAFGIAIYFLMFHKFNKFRTLSKT